MGFLSKLFKGIIKESNNQINIGGNVEGSINQGVNIEINDPATAIRKLDNQEQLEDIASSIAESISKKHPLYPWYETAVQMDNTGAKLYSKPLSPEAAAKYPKIVKAEFEIPNPNRYSMKTLQQIAYFSQTPIPMRMTKGTMMLGNEEDPYQNEIENFKRYRYAMVPPKLPKPFRAEIMIKGTLDYYDVLLQFQPINPDENIINLSNAGHANDVIFNITYYRDTGNITFNYQSLASTWIQVHKFLSFMISANAGKHIIIKDIERQITLLELPLPKPLYGEEYGLLQSDLELVKDVIKIEERYGVRLNPKKEFTDDDLQIISLLAKSMRGEKSNFHWTDISCNAILKPEVDSLDFTQIMTMSFNSTVDVMIQDQKITGLTSHIEFYNVLFAEPEKLQQSLVESENKKSIDIKMIPSNGENVAKIILQ